MVASLAWLSLWATVVPLATGWSSVAVTSGSMEPLIGTGDLVLTVPSGDDPIEPGSVVVFDDPASDGLITHRIVRQEDDGRYITRGDANARADSTPVPTESINGVGRILVPSMGMPLVWADTGQWAKLLTAGGLVFLALWMSRWAMLPRFDPWLHRSHVVRPQARSTAVRRLSVAALALGLLANSVGTSSAATYSASTDTDGTALGSDLLAPPTTLTIDGSGANIAMKWVPTPDTWATGHRIYRSAVSGGPYTLAAEITPQATNTYIDVPGPGTWFYVARAYAANWESVDSNEVSATATSDEDYDAIPNSGDNCPVTFNLDQFDTDGDGTGDACDGSATAASGARFIDSGQRLGASDSIGVAFGDVDGDGDLDLVYANSSNQSNTVWFNDGTGISINSGQLLGASRSRERRVGRPRR